MLTHLSSGFYIKELFFLKESSIERKGLERKNYFLKPSLKLDFWVAKDFILFLSHIPIMVMLGSIGFVTLS